MAHLFGDLIGQILLFFDTDDLQELLTVGLVSKKFNRAVRGPLIWKPLCKQIWWKEKVTQASAPWAVGPEEALAHFSALQTVPIPKETGYFRLYQKMRTEERKYKAMLMDVLDSEVRDDHPSVVNACQTPTTFILPYLCRLAEKPDTAHDLGLRIIADDMKRRIHLQTIIPHFNQKFQNQNAEMTNEDVMVELNWAWHPNWSPDRVRRLLDSTARDITRSFIERKPECAPASVLQDPKTFVDHVGAPGTVEHVIEELFDESCLGLRHRDDDFNTFQSHMVSDVLTRRKSGLPVTLATIFTAVLRRLGVSADITNTPNRVYAIVYIPGQPHISSDPNGQNWTVAFDVADGARVVVRESENPMFIPADPLALFGRCTQNLVRISSHKDEPAWARWAICLKGVAVSLGAMGGLPADHILRLKEFVFTLLSIPDVATAVLLLRDILRIRPEGGEEALTSEFSESALKQHKKSLSEKLEDHRQQMDKREYTVARYKVGTVFIHREHRYIGVIIGWDVKCKQSDEWQIQMGVTPNMAKEPFYLCLVDYRESWTDTYVWQGNIVADETVALSLDPPMLQRSRGLPWWDSPEGREERRRLGLHPVLHGKLGVFFRHWDEEQRRYIPRPLVQLRYPEGPDETDPEGPAPPEPTDSAGQKNCPESEMACD